MRCIEKRSIRLIGDSKKGTTTDSQLAVNLAANDDDDATREVSQGGLQGKLLLTVCAGNDRQ